MKNTAQKLSKDIKKFIEKYAKISPNHDPSDEDSKKFTGPDPVLLLMVTENIDNGKKPSSPWSSWESGCYGRNSDLKGREEHDSLLTRIREYIKELPQEKNIKVFCENDETLFLYVSESEKNLLVDHDLIWHSSSLKWHFYFSDLDKINSYIK